MRIILFFLFLCANLYSCKEAGNRSSLIKENEMSDIINDLSLAEAYVETYLMRDTSLHKDSLLKKEMQKVFKIHQVEEEQFSRSYGFYLKHPDLFKIIIDSANDRASRSRDRAYMKISPK